MSEFQKYRLLDEEDGKLINERTGLYSDGSIRNMKDSKDINWKIQSSPYCAGDYKPIIDTKDKNIVCISFKDYEILRDKYGIKTFSEKEKPKSPEKVKSPVRSKSPTKTKSPTKVRSKSPTKMKSKSPKKPSPSNSKKSDKSNKRKSVEKLSLPPKKRTVISDGNKENLNPFVKDKTKSPQGNNLPTINNIPKDQIRKKPIPVTLISGPKKIVPITIVPTQKNQVQIQTQNGNDSNSLKEDQFPIWIKNNIYPRIGNNPSFKINYSSPEILQKESNRIEELIKNSDKYLDIEGIEIDENFEIPYQLKSNKKTKKPLSSDDIENYETKYSIANYSKDLKFINANKNKPEIVSTDKYKDMLKNVTNYRKTIEKIELNPDLMSVMKNYKKKLSNISDSINEERKIIMEDKEITDAENKLIELGKLQKLLVFELRLKSKLEELKSRRKYQWLYDEDSVLNEILVKTLTRMQFDVYEQIKKIESQNEENDSSEEISESQYNEISKDLNKNREENKMKRMMQNEQDQTEVDIYQNDIEDIGENEKEEDEEEEGEFDDFIVYDD